jgi:hypothetical protein
MLISPHLAIGVPAYNRVNVCSNDPFTVSAVYPPSVPGAELPSTTVFQLYARTRQAGLGVGYPQIPQVRSVQQRTLQGSGCLVTSASIPRAEVNDD